MNRSDYYEKHFLNNLCIICEEKFPLGHLKSGFCFYCIKKLEKIKKKHNV